MLPNSSCGLTHPCQRPSTFLRMESQSRTAEDAAGRLRPTLHHRPAGHVRMRGLGVEGGHLLGLAAHRNLVQVAPGVALEARGA